MFDRGYIPRFIETTGRDGRTWYILLDKFNWYDKASGKYITVPRHYISDGATGAIDIESKGWWVHDWLCDGMGFDDGSPCSNWNASRILSAILLKEKRVFRAIYWRVATFIFGGNGLQKF